MSIKKVTHVVKITLGNEEKLVTLKSNCFVLGRDSSADVIVPLTAVSRRHLEVTIYGEKVHVRDLSSANGSFLNGIRLESQKSHLYTRKQKLQLAGSFVTVEIHANSETPNASVPMFEESRLVEPENVVKPVAKREKSPRQEFPEELSRLNRSDEEAPLELPELESEEEAAARSKVSLERFDAATHRSHEEPDAPLQQSQSQLIEKFKTIFKENPRPQSGAEIEEGLEAAVAASEALDLDLGADARKVDPKETAHTRSRESRKSGKKASRQAIHQKNTHSMEVDPQQSGEAEEIAEARLTSLRKESERLASERSRLQSEFERLQEQLQARMHELQRAEAWIADVERAHGQVLKEKEQALLSLADAQHQETEARKTAKNIELRMEALRNEERELNETNQQLRDTRLRLKQEQEEAARTRDEIQAELEAFEGDIQVRRIKLQVTLEEIELKRATAEKEVHLLNLQRQELLADLERQRKKSDQELSDALAGCRSEQERLKKKTEQEIAEAIAASKLELERLKKKSDQEIAEAQQVSLTELERLKTLSQRAVEVETRARDSVEKFKAEQGELEKRLADLRLQAETAESRLETLLPEIESAEAKKAGLHKEIQSVLDEVTAEAEQIRQKALRDAEQTRQEASTEVAELRQNTATEVAELKQNAATEVARLRQTAEKEVQAYSVSQKDRLDSEFTESAKRMEAELAQARLKELNEIDRLRAENQKAFKMRLDFQIQEIALRTRELVQSQLEAQANLLGNGGSEEADLKALRSLVEGILKGKDQSTQNVEAIERTRSFWKKTALKLAIPACLAVLYFIFPEAPGQAQRAVMRKLASSQAEPNVFMEQIKQRGLRYQPAQNREYRNTYSENILFLEKYAEIKLDERAQKLWIVALNEFLPKDLGLSDRVVVDLVASEAVMVQELVAIRTPIVELYKELGQTRMLDFEKAEAAKLIRLLEGLGNYEKFRQFEKNFYLKQLSSK